MAVIKKRSEEERARSQFFRKWDQACQAARVVVDGDNVQYFNNISEVPAELREEAIQFKAWLYRELRELKGTWEEAFQNYCDIIQRVTGVDYFTTYRKYGASRDDAITKFKSHFWSNNSIVSELYSFYKTQLPALNQRVTNLRGRIEQLQAMELPEGTTEDDRENLMRTYQIQIENLEEGRGKMEQLSDLWDIHSHLECWQPDKADTSFNLNELLDNDTSGGISEGAQSLASMLEQQLQNLQDGIAD